MRPLLVRWLARVAYADGLALQTSLVDAHKRGDGVDTLLLLEHPPVVTLGRSGDPRHVLADDEELARRGIQKFATGRGGDVTYHGPGQLVGYPVLALPPERRDAHRYLRDLEEVLIRAVADFGVTSGRVPGRTGVWVEQGKLAAIGVRLGAGWITSHGFALNVDGDLAGFRVVVPCGIADAGVASLAGLLGRTPDLREVAARVACRFAEVFELRPLPPRAPEERLAIDAGADYFGASGRGRH